MQTSSVAMIPKTETNGLTAIPNAQPVIESKEQMIVTLEVQNQDLLQVVDKTTDAYEKIIEEKDQTIATLSDLNDKLCIALTKANSDSNSLELIHEASLRGVQNKDEQRIAILNEQIQIIQSQMGDIKSIINNIPVLVDYKTLECYLASKGNFRSDFTLYTGTYPQNNVSGVMAILKDKMDDRYKNRPIDLLNVLTSEAAVQADIIITKLQNLKNETENK